MKDNIREMIEAFANETAKQSGVPEPHRSEGRHELVSNLWDRVQDLAKGEPTPDDVHAAIAAIGGPTGAEQAFFGVMRAESARSGWWRRIGAFLIDAVIVGIAVGLLAAPFVMMAMTSFLNSDVSPSDAPCTVWGFGPYQFNWYSEDHPCRPFWWIEILIDSLSFAGMMLYFTLMEWKLGRTLGKMALGIMVQKTDGGRISFGQAAGRSITKALGLVVIELLIGIFDSKKERISDKAAGTVVVTRP